VATARTLEQRMARWRRLAFEDTGGGGPAVLLLHGQPGSRADWAQVVAALAGDARVLVPDRPGYGGTGGRPLGFAGNAEAAVGLLDRLGIRRVIAVGHSWGAGVALALAARYPERVLSFVSIMSTTGSRWRGRPRRRRSRARGPLRGQPLRSFLPHVPYLTGD
jgi:pimeloyl-ACP methyl ester carboxylesterase